MSNLDMVRRYIAAVERFDVAAMQTLVQPDMEFVEMPNRLKPNGARSDLATMLVSLPKGAQILRRQSYPIDTLFGDGDMVLVRTRWEGVLNIALGSLQPGDTMVAHCAMIFTLRDGLIARQVNHDCYEPF